MSLTRSDLGLFDEILSPNYVEEMALATALFGVHVKP